MLYLILVLGLVLRLVSLNQSLWLDEAIGALVVRDLSVQQIFTSFLPVDNHPPLYYLMLKCWTSVLGFGEIALRLPSVIFGVATVYLVFLISIELTKKYHIGLLASLFLATSQFHIYYSQEARMYSMAAFFAVSSVYFYLRIIKVRVNIFSWVVFSLLLLLMLFTDYMTIFLLPVFIIHALIKKKNGAWWKIFIISFLPILIVGSIWYPTFYTQLKGGKWLMETVPTWRSVAGGASIKQLLLVVMKFTLGRISFRSKLFYYFITILTSSVFLIVILRTYRSLKKHLLVYFWLFIPIMLSFLLSFQFPIFIYFRLLYVLPALYLIYSISLHGFTGKRSAPVFVSILLLINLGSYLYYVTNPSQKREEWREAVSFVEKRIGPHEIVLFSYPEPFAPYRWYGKKLSSSFGATDSIYSDPLKTSEKTGELLANTEGVYYFEYLKDISDPSSVVLSTIENSGFREEKKIGYFNGIGFIYYFRR